MDANKNYMFIQVDRTGLITVKCQECNKNFGIDADFATSVSEVSFRYTCPYCGCKHLLKND